MKVWMMIGALLAAGLAVAAGDRWSVSLPPARTALPRLAGELALDGDIAEWAGATSMPLRYRSYITHRKPQHEWRGPTDAGAEMFAAWNDAGLCLAVRVADDDLRNDREPASYYARDCIELFVDGRVGKRFRTRPYTHGAYQLFVRPPLGDQPADIVVYQAYKPIPGLTAVAQLIDGGYTVEILIPWTAFPELQPAAGAHVGLQLGLDDSDARDGDLDQPLMMTWQAAAGLSGRPDKFIDCTLVTERPRGATMNLGVPAALDAPLTVLAGDNMTAAVEVGAGLAAEVAGATATVRNWAGAEVWRAALELTPLAAPWTPGVGTRFVWPLGNAEDGAYDVTVAFTDAAGQPLGVSTRAVLIARQTRTTAQAAVADALAALAGADLAAMAPCRATAWVGLAAAVEKTERMMQIGGTMGMLAGQQELTARLAVLQGRPLPAETAPLWRLCRLGADPNVRVVVEYPRRDPQTAQDMASVSFYWGAIPLAGVWVIPCATEAAAQQQAAAVTNGLARTAGTLLLRCISANPEVADLAIAAVAAGEPVGRDTVDAIRQALLTTVTPPAEIAPVPDGMALYCGDVHSHTFYSDGIGSPIGLVCESLYCGMDFLVISDHNTLAGARFATGLMAAHGFGHRAIVGEEVTTSFEHFNAYPLTELVSWKISEPEIVAAAHAQGAVVQWNHPGWRKEHPWTARHLVEGIAGTGVDAWEHRPREYDAWREAGKLPVIVGSTDTHSGTFDYLERTIFLARGTSGADLADAMRRGDAIMVSAFDPHYLLGSERLRGIVIAALREGDGLLTRSAEHARAALAEARLVDLLNASPPEITAK